MKEVNWPASGACHRARIGQSAGDTASLVGAWPEAPDEAVHRGPIGLHVAPSPFAAHSACTGTHQRAPGAGTQAPAKDENPLIH